MRVLAKASLYRFPRLSSDDSQLRKPNGIQYGELPARKVHQGYADLSSQPPPPQSKPEASNFPTHQYTMSQDHGLFQPPKSYPEPPKDMYYKVLGVRSPVERPRQIFPWETNQAKPTRVFAEDNPPSPEALSTTDTESSLPPSEAPTTPTIQISSPEPFSSFSRTNAWDEVPEIERYIQALSLNRRGKFQVLQPETSSEVVSSGTADAPSRRPSMKLTDFPTEFERPSLPVTPAAIGRPTFWGEDREEQGNLPGAEGVPKQQDWNPMAKLQELRRRQSEVLAQGPPPPPSSTRNIPDRNLPEHASLVPTSEETEVPMTSVSASATDRGSVFRSVDLGAEEKSGREEGVFSPTES